MAWYEFSVTDKPDVPIGDVARFLVGQHGGPIESLAPLAGGFWSAAYGCHVGGQDLVLRLGTIAEGFDADRAAMVFDAPDDFRAQDRRDRARVQPRLRDLRAALRTIPRGRPSGRAPAVRTDAQPAAPCAESGTARAYGGGVSGRDDVDWPAVDRVMPAVPREPNACVGCGVSNARSWSTREGAVRLCPTCAALGDVGCP